MLVLELCHVVDILIDNNVEVVSLVVCGHVGGRKGLGHDDATDESVRNARGLKIQFGSSRGKVETRRRSR